MIKIPVRQTIASAYRFAFVEMERVIGVIWLPIIVLTVVDYFINSTVLTARAAALETGDQSQLGPVMASQFGYLIVSLILQAMIAVAICRELLKPMERPLWLRFTLGGMEFRYLGAMLGLSALAGLVALACLVVGRVLAGMIHLPGLPPGQAAIGMAGLIGFVLCPLLIYAFVRLGALALPAVVTERGVGLERSWQMLKGNVGRMLLVMLGAGVPVMVVYLGAYVAIVGPETFLPHLDQLGDTADRLHQEAELLRQTSVRLPWIEGLDFILAPFLYGLAIGAQVFVYKTLTGGAKPPAVVNA